MRLTTDFNPKKGDWLFTCRMEPVQFNEWDHAKPVDLNEMRADMESGAYHREYTPQEIDAAIADAASNQPDPNDPNWFSTLDGSCHSAADCGLKLISESYARWFIDNQMWKWLTFFQTEHVLVNAEWVRYVPPSPLAGTTYWYRSTPGGVRYHYRRTKGVNRFTFITYGGSEPYVPSPNGVINKDHFAYFPTKQGFSIKTRGAWDVYEGYIRWRCWSENIKYEGY